jgi:hypothetical protein
METRQPSPSIEHVRAFVSRVHRNTTAHGSNYDARTKVPTHTKMTNIEVLNTRVVLSADANAWKKSAFFSDE